MIDRGKVAKGLHDATEVIRTHVPPQYIGYSEQACWDALELLDGKDNDVIDKLRIENSELLQRILQLEKELSKELAYNYALVTVIKNNYPTKEG